MPAPPPRSSADAQEAETTHKAQQDIKSPQGLLGALLLVARPAGDEHIWSQGMQK